MKSRILVLDEAAQFMCIYMYVCFDSIVNTYAGIIIIHCH